MRAEKEPAEECSSTWVILSADSLVGRLFLSYDITLSQTGQKKYVLISEKMIHKHLKKLVACYGIAGLLTTIVHSTGCSKQEDPVDKPEELETSHQQSPVEDDADASKKATKPDGTEVQIRGNSG